MQWRDFLDKLLEDADSVLNIEAVEGIEDAGNPPVDLMLIGGASIEFRKTWIDAIPEMVNPGGWVMLGNVNHPKLYEAVAELKKKAATVKTFDFNSGGSRFHVMEFYKLPGKPKRRSKDGEDDLSR